MKKSTLLTATLAVATLTAGAQTPAAAQLQKAQQAVRAFLSPTKAPQKAAAKASQKVYTPSSASTSTYNNGSWDYAYDTEYTYDANQNITQTVTKNGDTYLEKTTYTYDPTTPSLLITVDHQTWQESLNGWGEAENLFTNTVTRNADGTIKSIHTVSNGYNDETGESTLNATYGSDKVLKTVDYTYTEDDEKTTVTFKNIEWYQTDGDFDLSAMFGDDLSGIMEGNNRLKSADVTMAASYVSIPGTLTTTYTDNSWKATMTLSLSYGFYTMSMSMGYEKQYTDSNGSYTYVLTADYDGETEYEKEVVTKDEHGSVTQDDIYYGTSAADATLYDTAKAEMTYDADGRPITQVVYGYDQTTSTYVPSTKTEFEYGTTAINNAAIASNAAPAAVYNLHGTLVGRTLDTLPAGIYIVREGGKTVKRMKQ